MAIKAIVFDCFGVLVTSAHTSYWNDFPEHKQELDDLRKSTDYGYVSREDFDKELSRLTGIPVSEVEDAYWNKGVRSESAFDWLKELKTTGEYKIGLLSNIGKGWLDDFIPKAEREELFDGEVLSGYMGMIKPEPEIFQAMADVLGCNTSECVMIDDILENLEGASKVGMLGVLYTTTDQAKADVARIISENA